MCLLEAFYLAYLTAGINAILEKKKNIIVIVMLLSSLKLLPMNFHFLIVLLYITCKPPAFSDTLN